MVKKHQKILIMGIVAAFIAVNFVAIAQASTTPSPSGELVIGTAIETTLTNLNPLTVTNSLASDLVQQMYADNLMHMWPNGNLTPWLANSYTITEHTNGSESIQYNLNQNAEWINGTNVAGALTSKDVKFTFDLLMANTSLDSTGVTHNLTSVTTPNNTTVVFNFNVSSPLWLTFTSQQTIIPASWASYDNGNLASLGNFVNMKAKIGQELTAGPFYLSDSTSEGATLTANTHFWMGSPKINKVYFEEFKSTAASTEALKTGSISAEFPSLSDYNSLSLTPNITNVVFAEPWIFNLWMNDQASPFNNTHLRMGFAYAINKQQIISKAEDGQGAAGPSNTSYGGLPTLLKQYWAPGITYYAYNTTKAKQQIEMAGYNLSKTGYFVNNTTHKTLSVTIVDPAIADWEAAATFIVSDLQSVGVQASLQITPFSTWADDAFNVSNFQNGIMTYFGYVPSYTNAYYDLSDLYDYDGGANFNVENFNDPALNAIFNSSSTITNTTQLKQELYKAQKIIDETVPVIQIGNAYNYYAYNNNQVKGFLPNLTINDPYNLMQVYAVKAPSSNTPGLSNTTLYEIIGGVVVAIVVIGGVAFGVRKRGKKED